MAKDGKVPPDSGSSIIVGDGKTPVTGFEAGDYWSSMTNWGRGLGEDEVDSGDQ